MRIPVAVVFSEESIFITTVGSYFSSCKTEETLGHIFVVYLLIFRESVQIAVDLLDDHILFEQGARDKKRVLKVHLILLVVVVVCKFRVSGQSQISWAV